MPVDARRVRDLFLAAAELPVAERAAYLTAHCSDDAELRAAVERLLAAHEQPASVLVRPAPGIPTAEFVSITEKPGTKIGPFKLLQQIGEGGMGVVYMAEQEHPVRRKVALKIIKPGMDSHQVIARFEAERQALALMDHQNVARVFDAGTTDSGRPYFVMELVHGVPITQFCDDHQLTPRERLALFVPVCQAIQHAHQKGIIHRDIKPSNVLVTMYDDKPVPKVIDFGVAKAVEQRLTEKTLFTQYGALVGTFEYMSPEQAEMNAFGVDTRSDVYSLGVLLYELLTGTTPIERTRLRAAALDEMVRLIKEEEAPRPSVRLSTSNNLPKIAAARKTEPGQLSKLVRGEVDWIVMKCLEKDRSRRYDSASGLARDVERHLADEPVEACPPSAGYRLAKFARKYKKALATAAAFAVLLVAGVVLSTTLAVWAVSAGREANRQRLAAVEARGEADKQRDEARQTAYAAGIGLAQRAWEEDNVLRARELLEELPREAAGRSLRGFEWHYLNRLFHPELQTLRHSNSFKSVTFSPDGQRLAAGSSDGTVKVWESATGKEVLSLRGPSGEVWGVAFSPDGKRLASAEKDTVQVWDSVTGKPLHPLKGHSGSVGCVAFSPDRRWIASGGEDKTSKIWDSTTGKLLHSLRGHDYHVATVVFSPDSKRLAVGSGDEVAKVWDVATGKPVLSLVGHTDTVTCLAFSPDGRRIASGSDDSTVKIWDSATGKLLFSNPGHADSVWGVAFSPDGKRLLSGGDDWLLKVWDVASGKQLFTLRGHVAEVMGVAWSPDGQRLASASHDRTVKLWDIATVKEPFCLKVHADRVRCVAFSLDGRRIAFGGQDKMAKVWDSATGKQLHSLEHADGVRCVAFSSDGRRIASGGDDKTVKVWDSAAGKQVFFLEGHDKEVTSVAFSLDGQRLASGSWDKTVKVWDNATGKELFSLKGHAGAVWCVAFSPDGQRLASGSGDKTVKVWDSATGKELLSLQAHARPVWCVAFSPDGQRLASGSSDGTVKVWDIAAGKEPLSLKGHVWGVNSIAFSPDGQRLASGSGDKTVKVWDSATGKELLSLKGHTRGVESVAFSPDGRRVASASADGTINLWETTISPEVKDRRAAMQLVADLFRERGLRADVVEWLRTAPGMRPDRRQAALDAAGAHPEDPATLHQLARELLKRADRPASDYRQALRLAEQACQLDLENALYRTTLGMANYRAGNEAKALKQLAESDSTPANLAFLAMTQHRLGHAQEAQAVLQRLRECLKDPRRAQDGEAQGFLREAEAVLAKPTPAGGK